MEKDSNVKAIEDNRKLSINSYVTKNFLQQKQNKKQVTEDFQQLWERFKVINIGDVYKSVLEKPKYVKKKIMTAQICLIEHWKNVRLKPEFPKLLSLLFIFLKNCELLTQVILQKHWINPQPLLIDKES